MSAWAALVVAGALTWVCKAGPSLLGSRVRLPDVLERANRFVVPALLGSLTARGVAAQASGAGGPAALVAAAVAVPVAARTRSVLATVAAGTLAFLAGSAVMG